MSETPQEQSVPLPIARKMYSFIKRLRDLLGITDAPGLAGEATTLVSEAAPYMQLPTLAELYGIFKDTDFRNPEDDWDD